MRLIIVASLAVALGGCLSVPVTPTAYNDDACLQRSVMSTPRIKYAGPPAGPPEAVPESKCRPMPRTWAADKQSNRQNDANRY